MVLQPICIPEEESSDLDTNSDDEQRDRASVAFKIGSPKRSKSYDVEHELQLRLLDHAEGSSSSKAPHGVLKQQHTSELKDKLLIELYDLDYSGSSEGRWIETARWIKYEEDVEGYDHHWGQPHVACLFFDNITVLRSILNRCIMITDLNVPSYTSLIENVAGRLNTEGPHIKEKILELMRLRQIHVASRRVPRSSTVMGFSRLPYSKSSVPIRVNQNSRLPNAFSMPYTPELLTNSPTGQLNADGSALRTASTDLLKVESAGVIPNYESNESAQVFVGECPEWKTTRLILVRLSSAMLLPEVVEAPIPIRFFLFLLGPPSEVVYHEMGRSLCTMLANKNFKNLAYAATTGPQLAAGLDAFLHESVVLPPGEIDSRRLIQVDDIKRIINRREHLREMKTEISKVRAIAAENDAQSDVINEAQGWRFFNGMFQDLYERGKHYRSDFTDGFSYQCLSSVIFIFLASITPAITFGGLMGDYTGEAMGMIETLMAQCICGVIWGLFSAQPLIIISATGPVLIFEGALFTICTMFSFDFLTVRFFAGAWIFLISLVVVALEGSRLLKYVTAFIEEIFAVLISAIFIAEGIKFIIRTFRDNPVENYEAYLDQHLSCVQNATSLGLSPDSVKRTCSRLPEPNTALLTFIVMLSTFAIACVMRAIRHSFWFGRTFRNFFGDFGVAIALIVVALITHVFFDDVYLQRLEIPSTLAFTNLVARGHGLLVWPSNTDPFAVLVGLVAALLVFILIFVETEITELLLSRKERRLIKGCGMSWDLVLSGFCAFLCSLLGLPWMCAAAVQSLAHCSSLTVKEKKAPGERDGYVRVIEQRLTTIGNALLTGLFAFGGRYLRLPTASLFGVFTYLGIMNLIGVELIYRTMLFFLPVKYYPNKAYVNSVKTSKLHCFTLIQLLLVAVVYIVKHFKVTAVGFPFALMLFIVFRHTVMPCIFSDIELDALDGEAEDNEDEESSEVDFYGKTAIPV